MLSQSLPADRFAEIFATQDFVRLVRSVLGIGAVDEQQKILESNISELRDAIHESHNRYKTDLAPIEDRLRYLEGPGHPIDYTVTEIYEEKIRERDGLSASYNSFRGDKEAAIKQAEESIQRLTLPYDPVKTEIASQVSKSSLECCLKQFKHIEKNPVTVSLYEEPINKAATLTGIIVDDIKANMEQTKRIAELEAFKTKKERKKRKEKMPS